MNRYTLKVQRCECSHSSGKRALTSCPSMETQRKAARVGLLMAGNDTRCGQQRGSLNKRWDTDVESPKWVHTPKIWKKLTSNN